GPTSVDEVKTLGTGEHTSSKRDLDPVTDSSSSNSEEESQEACIGTETQLDPCEKFKVDNFYTILDCLRNELEHRVNAYSEIKKLFSFFTEYGSMKYDDLKTQLELVVSTYYSDLEASVLDEFLQFKDILSSESDRSVTNISTLLRSKDGILTNDFPNISILIQWNWPENYDEEKFIMILGGLHIEMAALRMAGSWLQGSGWTETLVQADIACPGTANSFLKAAHVTRTRRGHQITAATVNIVQHKAYGKYTEDAQSDGHEPLDDNKEELFSLLSEQVMQLVVKESKQLVVTDKKQVLTVPPRKDTANLAPCNHEEADTRMMVHAADALECGHRRILIRTVDTDVVILAVALANERSEVLDELWLTFGTGKNRRYIAAHQIAKALGPEKSRALPVFHAITGCDTVSVFAGHSKKTAWATWNAFPERFIVLFYDRTSTCCDVNVLRKKLFSRKSRSLEHLPPTRAALEQHIKRAAYQAGHIWGQAAIAFVILPSPCDWGWMKSGDELKPLWTTLSEVSKSCHELISCGCRKHCGGN
ncbi:hypothetical protein Hamer_G027474, partial [Homarus americanus]